MHCGDRIENCCAAYCRLFAAIFRAAARHEFYLIRWPAALNAGGVSLEPAFGILLGLIAACRIPAYDQDIEGSAIAGDPAVALSFTAAAPRREHRAASRKPLGCFFA